MILVSIHMTMDTLCGRLSNDGKVKLVLDFCEKIVCSLRVFIIISATLGKNIRKLKVYTPLTRTYGADTLKELSEIILFKSCFSLLQTLIIQNKSLDDIFSEYLGRPNAELCTSIRFYTISNRNNYVKVIMLY